MLDDRSGDVARRRFLQAAPSGDPVDLDYVLCAVARREEIDAGVVRAHRFGGGPRRLAPARRQRDGPRPAAARQVGLPPGRAPLDRADHAPAYNEGPHVAPVVSARPLSIINATEPP